MKFNAMKEEISVMLTSLTEQFETMDAHKGSIPHIEVDIFMRNIQKLYEDMNYLKKLNENFIPEVELNTQLKEVHYQNVEENKSEVSIKETIAEETKEVKVVSTQESEIVVQEIKVEEPILQEKIIDEAFADVHMENSILDDIVEQPNMESDLFTQVKASAEISDLNKKLADARNTNSIVEKLQNKRIENLKSVIGINDKFYFINELFGGDTQKYEDIIYTLNNFKKLEDAMQYFSTLKYRFNWDEETEPFLKLVNMLERKFNLADA